MPSLYMVRTPGANDFRGLTHLKEGRVYDNVSKDDAQRLIEAGIAEDFDEDAELHVKAVEEFNHLDARKTEQPVVMKATAPKASDYESMTVEELHKEAANRNLEGRSTLTNKELLVKALEKDDKGKGKK
jgi:hypothetical protein